VQSAILTRQVHYMYRKIHFPVVPSLGRGREYIVQLFVRARSSSRLRSALIVDTSCKLQRWLWCSLITSRKARKYRFCMRIMARVFTFWNYTCSLTATNDRLVSTFSGLFYWGYVCATLVEVHSRVLHVPFSYFPDFFRVPPPAKRFPDEIAAPHNI